MTPVRWNKHTMRHLFHKKLNFRACLSCWDLIQLARIDYYFALTYISRLHDVVQQGTTVQFVSSAGDFTCFESQGVVKARRLLLLSGGIGVTPMLAMLRGLREEPPEQLDVVGVHTARTETDVPFRCVIWGCSRYWRNLCAIAFTLK
jgi:hypothetical protein